jgi:hypothetical protein
MLSACSITTTTDATTSPTTMTGERTYVPILMGPLPTNGTEAPDDIVNTPGGSAYRANVHQQGIPDKWPSIETVETKLANGPDTINVRYRNNIATNAGQIRNNLIYVTKENGRFESGGVFSIKLYIVGPPSSLKFSQGGAGGLPGSIVTDLVIEIPQSIESGSYGFNIGLEVEGKDYGILLCTVVVTG